MSGEEIELRGGANHIATGDELRLDFVVHGGDLGPWTIGYEVRAVEGHLVITALRIDLDPVPEEFVRGDTDEAQPPGYPPRGITSALVKQVRVGQFLQAARAEALRLPNDDPIARALRGGPRSEQDQRARDRAAAAVKGEKRPQGRKMLGEDRLIEVALAVLEIEKRGLPRANAQLMEELGLHSESYARNLKRKARERGLLSPGERGRRGATPGPRLAAALAIRKERDDDQST